MLVFNISDEVSSLNLLLLIKNILFLFIYNNSESYSFESFILFVFLLILLEVRRALYFSNDFSRLFSVCKDILITRVYYCYLYNHDTDCLVVNNESLRYNNDDNDNKII